MQLESIIAHRGASAYSPENTIAAFSKAHELGCRMVEFDVMLSQDGEAFVFHDDKLKRTTNGKGEIGLVAADFLRSLDAGRWFSKRYAGEKIPSLEETIQWLAKTGMQANIEIKPYAGQSEETAAAVLAAINLHWPQEKELPLLSSFDTKSLNFCRSIYPEIPLGLLLDKWDPNWLQTAKNLLCYSVHLNKNVLTKERVMEIKEQNYKICAYTVNRKREALKLFSWGLDAVFSDYPDLLS